jgi:hypothetical protein
MSTCLHQAYIEQMVVSNGTVFVINIKLSDGLYLDLVPNCEYNNSDYQIDFETPIKSPFLDEYKYNGIDNTALLLLNKNTNKKNLKNNNIAKKNSLEGILFVENIFWCENTDENKNIQLKIYKKFEFLDEINGNFLMIESNYNDFLTKLNNNNSKGFYLFNNEFTLNDFVIYNNEFAVIIGQTYGKLNKDYGNTDSLVFLSIMHENSTKLNLESNIINFLKEKIKLYYEYYDLDLAHLNIFKNDFKKIEDHIFWKVVHNQTA